MNSLLEAALEAARKEAARITDEACVHTSVLLPFAEVRLGRMRTFAAALGKRVPTCFRSFMRGGSSGFVVLVPGTYRSWFSVHCVGRSRRQAQQKES